MHKSYSFKTGFDQMDVAVIHDFLSKESYWAKGIPFETVETSLKNSYCIAAFDQDDRLVGFAGIITDYATFAYLKDVFVLPEHRGKGLSKRMMEQIMQEPWVEGLRRFMLATADAHGLYSQFGFTEVGNPETLMVISRPNRYLSE